MFRKLLNTDASATNTLEVFKSESGCCGSTTSLAKCQYTSASMTWADVVTNGGLDSITVSDEGTTTVLAFPSPITVVADLKDAIIAAAKTIGYVLDDNPLDVVVTGTTTVVVDIYGELKVTTSTDGTASYAYTEKCTTKVISDYTGSFGSLSVNPVISVDGTTATVTGTFTIDASGATALQAAIASAITGEQSVSVVYDAVDDTLDVTITYDNGTDFIFDGKVLIEGNVRSIFTA
jgi:hypothetical protein